MFFSFNQNNSGGSFDFDEASGITHWVIIEADSIDEATSRAKSIGLYFDGCDDGIDCPCCGDRWYEPDDVTQEPAVYGQALTAESADNVLHHRWMQPGKEACVHYKDGRKEWF